MAIAGQSPPPHPRHSFARRSRRPLATLLGACSLAGLLLLAPVAGRGQGVPAGDALDREVLKIFRAKCVACHDDLGAKAGGSVDYVADLPKLADPENGYFDPDTLEDSYLHLLIESGDMPQRRFKRIEWNGPLTDTEKAAVLRWIVRGDPPAADPKPPAAEEMLQKPAVLITPDDIRDLVRADQAALAKIGRGDEAFARYLTLFNLKNDPAVSAADLDLYRRGTVKLLNSLSTASEVVAIGRGVEPVGGSDHTYRFDLRDLNWTAAKWDRLAKASPNRFVTTREEAAAETGDAVDVNDVLLRADWFTFTASQPPFYHDLLDIADTLDGIDRSLNLDRAKAILDGTVSRAGLFKSGVSEHNRLLERIVLPDGRVIWLSYDFAGEQADAQRLDREPDGPASVLKAAGLDGGFVHDGGEAIWFLPNGFQAYALVTAAGNRLEVAPTDIVFDNSMVRGAIINGISCISCHADGMKPENPVAVSSLDEIRAVVFDDRRRFDVKARQRVRKLYPSQATFANLLQEDRARFRRAMALAKVDGPGGEPIRALFDRYARDVSVRTLAGEFGLTEEAFRQRMTREGELRTLLARIDGGGLRRDDWERALLIVVRLAGLGEPARPVRPRVPYFGDKFATSAPVGPVPGAPELPKPLGVRERAVRVGAPQAVVPRLAAEQINGPFRLSLTTDKVHYVEGETMSLTVTANRDCYLVVETLDPNRNVVRLIPNEYQAEVKLKAGVPTALPTPWNGRKPFELEIQPPHGRSEIKAYGFLKKPNLAPGRPLGAFRSLGKVGGDGTRGIVVVAPRDTPPVMKADDPALLENPLDGLRRDEVATATATVVTRPPLGRLSDAP